MLQLKRLKILFICCRVCLTSSDLRDRRIHDHDHDHGHDHAWSCVIRSFFRGRDRDRAWSDIFLVVVIVTVIGKKIL